MKLLSSFSVIILCVSLSIRCQYYRYPSTLWVYSPDSYWRLTVFFFSDSIFSITFFSIATFFLIVLSCFCLWAFKCIPETSQIKYQIFLLVVYLVVTLDFLLISRLHFLLKKKVLNYFFCIYNEICIPFACNVFLFIHINFNVLSI